MKSMKVIDFIQEVLKLDSSDFDIMIKKNGTIKFQGSIDEFKSSEYSDENLCNWNWETFNNNKLTLVNGF